MEGTLCYWLARLWKGTGDHVRDSTWFACLLSFFKRGYLCCRLTTSLWRGRFNLKNKNGPRGDASVLPLNRNRRETNVVKVSTAWLMMLQGQNNLFRIELLHISDMLQKDSRVTLKSACLWSTLWDSIQAVQFSVSYDARSRLQRKTPSYIKDCEQPSFEAFCCRFGVLQKLSVPSRQISALLGLLGTEAKLRFLGPVASNQNGRL